MGGFLEHIKKPPEGFCIGYGVQDFGSVSADIESGEREESVWHHSYTPHENDRTVTMDDGLKVIDRDMS